MQRLKGEEQARGLEYQKTGTLLGMSQQRLAAANEARRQAKEQQMAAVGDIAGAGLDLATAGMKAGVPKKDPGIGSMATSIGSVDLNKDNIPDYLENPNQYGVPGGQIGPSQFPFKRKNKKKKKK